MGTKKGGPKGPPFCRTEKRLLLVFHGAFALLLLLGHSVTLGLEGLVFLLGFEHGLVLAFFNFLDLGLDFFLFDSQTGCAKEGVG